MVVFLRRCHSSSFVAIVRHSSSFVTIVRHSSSLVTTVRRSSLFVAIRHNHSELHHTRLRHTVTPYVTTTPLPSMVVPVTVVPVTVVPVTVIRGARHGCASDGRDSEGDWRISRIYQGHIENIDADDVENIVNT